MAADSCGAAKHSSISVHDLIRCVQQRLNTVASCCDLIADKMLGYQIIEQPRVDTGTGCSEER